MCNMEMVPRGTIATGSAHRYQAILRPVVVRCPPPVVVYPCAPGNAHAMLLAMSKAHNSCSYDSTFIPSPPPPSLLPPLPRHAPYSPTTTPPRQAGHAFVRCCPPVPRDGGPPGGPGRGVPCASLVAVSGVCGVRARCIERACRVVALEGVHPFHSWLDFCDGIQQLPSGCV